MFAVGILISGHSTICGVLGLGIPFQLHTQFTLNVSVKCLDYISKDLLLPIAVF